MTRVSFRLIVAAVVIAGWVGVVPASAHQQQVVINGDSLSAPEVATLSSRLGTPILPGNYWYDTTSGLWGYRGGPAMGQLPTGLPEVDAPLRADASGGGTQVFINGRAIHPSELAQLRMMMGTIPPGRYAVNAYGQVALEGQPFPPLPAGPGQNGLAQGQAGSSVFLPGRTSTGAADGLHVGQASDGCTYIVTGDYSAESC